MLEIALVIRPVVSGARDARWFLFLPRLMDSDQLRLDEQGAPMQIWAFLPADQGSLYRLTIWPPIALLAPPALGVARAALDDLLALARAKTPSYTGSTLNTRQVVQRQVAEAEATLGVGRAYLPHSFQDNWAAAVQGAEITLERKLQMR